MQGLKGQYDKRAAASVMYKTNASIKDGLKDISSIGYDIMNIQSGGNSYAQSMHGNSHSNIEKPPKDIQKNNMNIEDIYDVKNTSKMNQDKKDSSSIINNTTIINPLDGNNIMIKTTNKEDNDYLVDSSKVSSKNLFLSRLIIAEESLNARQRQGRGSPSSEEGGGGADLLQSVVSDCILASVKRSTNR
eukprot:CAMPEP_0119052014 /NCGR_PEP_ID=MMETSP1177-20130426/73453_1 /TAXON_ID=2985 /ORGANISM="Ochromonas sp, Strain CCMP1899" /LENGTH=188 /DNA_ID=CAMNT_0007031439 /DNA_START=258 /DNA_END=824 /DNA_ORIENTATION=+